MSLKTISRNSVPGLAVAAAVLLGAGAQAQTIEVESLEPVDPFGVGVLTQSQGGLPGDLWDNTNGGLIAESIARAPRDSQSPAVNRLVSRILLSGGEPPEDADSAALAAARLGALVEAGFATQAARLAARTPDVEENPALAEIAAQGALSGGDLEAACETADGLTEGRDGAFWLRLRAVCLAAEGQTARADLTAQLARQEGRNEQFERAYSLALAGELPEEDVQTADPLVFAAAVRAGARIAVPASAPRAMRMTPLPGAPADMRAADLTRAGAMGLADAETVVAAYEAVEPPVLEEGQSLRELAEAAEPGVAEAWLYQRAADGVAPAGERAEAIAAALDRASADPGAFILASRVMAGPLRALPAQAGRDWALLFAMAAAAAEAPDLAQRWRETASTAPAPEPAGPADANAPVSLALAPPWDPPAEADLAAIDALIALYEDAPEAAASRLEDPGDQAVRFIDAVVLDALGKSGEPTLRLAFLTEGGGDGARAAQDTLLVLESAAEAEAMGEAGLMAAGALGQGPGALAPADLSRVLRALAAAGLEREAREAGLEAMLAARL